MRHSDWKSPSTTCLLWRIDRAGAQQSYNEGSSPSSTHKPKFKNLLDYRQRSPCVPLAFPFVASGKTYRGPGTCPSMMARKGNARAKLQSSLCWGYMIPLITPPLCQLCGAHDFDRHTPLVTKMFSQLTVAAIPYCQVYYADYGIFSILQPYDMYLISNSFLISTIVPYI